MTTSREVIIRDKATRDVVQAGETHGAGVADAIERALRQHLSKGERMPDVALLMRLCGQRLAATHAELAAADEAHERELGDDAAPRVDRDTTARALYAEVVELRGIIESAHGATALSALRVTGATPEDPATLAAWTSNLVKRLRDRSIELPAPKRRSVRIDREVEASSLEEKLTPLVTALGDVAREKREAETTQARKNAAMDAHDAVYSVTVALFDALLRMGGHGEQADKLRPVRSRGARGASDTDGDTDATKAPVATPTRTP